MRLIKGKKRISYKPDINTYKRAILRFCEERNLLESTMTPETWYLADKDSFIKMLYLEIKLIRYDRKKMQGGIKTREAARDWLDTLFFMEDMFSTLTPRDLLHMFPVTKSYDGAHWENKDYFYTMDKIAVLEIDKPLRSQISVFELLYDYQNMDISMFVLEVIEAIDVMRRLDGRQGMLEEYMAEQDIVPVTYHEKEGYIYDPVTGKSFAMKKPKQRMPKWMKILEGRNE